MLYSKTVILTMNCPIFSYSISKDNMILINTSLKTNHVISKHSSTVNNQLLTILVNQAQ